MLRGVFMHTDHGPRRKAGTSVLGQRPKTSAEGQFICPEHENQRGPQAASAVWGYGMTVATAVAVAESMK